MKFLKKIYKIIDSQGFKLLKNFIELLYFIAFIILTYKIRSTSSMYSSLELKNSQAQLLNLQEQLKYSKTQLDYQKKELSPMLYLNVYSKFDINTNEYLGGDIVVNNYGGIADDVSFNQYYILMIQNNNRKIYLNLFDYCKFPQISTGKILGKIDCYSNGSKYNAFDKKIKDYNKNKTENNKINVSYVNYLQITYNDIFSEKTKIIFSINDKDAVALRNEESLNLANNIINEMLKNSYNTLSIDKLDLDYIKNLIQK